MTVDVRTRCVVESVELEEAPAALNELMDMLGELLEADDGAELVELVEPPAALDEDMDMDMLDEPP